VNEMRRVFTPGGIAAVVDHDQAPTWCRRPVGRRKPT
jgi:hypothetical protein